MKIRDAEEKDALQLISLLSQIGYVLSLDEMKARIEAFKTKYHQLTVIEVANEVIAMIAFGCYEQLRLTGSCCHIDALVIDVHHRGKGLGKQLIAVAEKYAIDHGAKTVELLSANHRKKDGAHAFYDALDYKNHIALDCAYFAKENLV